jgi:hypothetical protein
MSGGVMPAKKTAVKTVYNALKDADRALDTAKEQLVLVEDTLGKLEAETNYRVRITFQRSIAELVGALETIDTEVERMFNKVRAFAEAAPK